MMMNISTMAYKYENSAMGVGLCGTDFVGGSKAERETIHSGQFMVSHFEAEEAQDDLVDSEIKMLDPEDPSLSKPDEPNPCMEVQLYVPRKVTQFQNDDNSAGSITSHLEIETSLTKLFKCMNLAYSQKLTSPKWNHFKGVRLRWKDKIRLNNVIWRCWHMQFILKRKTPVCQFASPLDVDVHSNPQSVVLEGKYWKRQLAVIKAEYRKWRRNYKSKATGCLTYDTKSELDFLDWSPLNDRSLMLSDDWTSDTLFSAINGPFPFPDPREIARGAGIADFIQPSLGPLQPNLDDIDVTFAELLQNSRLPPVPEEGTDEMLKGVEYNFSAIMGSEQMDSSNMLDTNNMQQLQSNDDANMMELNTPLNCMQYGDIEQQFNERQRDNLGLISGPTTSNNIANEDAMMTEERNTVLLPETSPTSIHSQGKHYGGNAGQNCNEYPGKSVIKGRISKSFQRPFRREPHNYDKAQPTMHQTTIYQQMLAEQQKNQQHLQPNLSSSPLHHATTSFQQQQQQQSPHLHYALPQYAQSAPPLLSNNNTYRFNTEPTTALNNRNLLTTINDVAANQKNFVATQANAASMLPNVKIEPPTSADLLTIFNVQPNSEVYCNSNSYKPYPSAADFKKSNSTGSYLNIRSASANQAVYLQDHNQPVHQRLATLPVQTQLVQLSPPHSSQQSLPILSQQMPQQQQQAPTQSQNIMPKEMFRSNSLPLNVSLQKLDNFAVPKFHAKSSKARSRSNSIHQHMTNNLVASQQLQPATSDPMLNSTVAQLLTKYSRITPSDKQHSASTSAISTSLNLPVSKGPTMPVPTTAANKPQTASAPAASMFLSSAHTSSLPVSMLNKAPGNSSATHELLQVQFQQQQQPQQKSPKKSASLPAASTPSMLHSPTNNKMLSYPLTGAQVNVSPQLSLSPESFHDQDSPLSPTHSLKYPRDNQRRAGHIHAEQKRRYNIKNGFDMLHSLIPQLQQNPNAKLSKAAMLQKGADHIKHLQTGRNLLKEKMEALRQERDTLNNSLTHLQSILPANGAPVTRQGTEHVKQLYEQYVAYRTMNNWKFWILGFILEPLLSSYTSSVSSASMEELRRTAFLWVDQHCSLIDLRPAVSNKLKYLSMKTDILSDPPSTLKEEVAKAIHNTSGQHPNLHGT